MPERLLYCPVFKAASTSWLVNFLKLSNRWSSELKENIYLNDNSKSGWHERYSAGRWTSTQRKETFIRRASTCSQVNKKHWINTKKINLFSAPATFKLRRKIFDESTKFIVVSGWLTWKWSSDLKVLFSAGSTSFWEASVCVQRQTGRVHKVLLFVFFFFWDEYLWLQEPYLSFNEEASNWKIQKKQEVKISNSNFQVIYRIFKWIREV